MDAVFRISFAVRKDLMDAVFHILIYLKSAQGKGLIFRKN
jgi:hypothetical protein